MFFIDDNTLDHFIKEDVPFLDLTTLLLGIGNEPGVIRFTAREWTVLAGVEEVSRILHRLGISVMQSVPSGSHAAPGDTFLVAQGPASQLHIAWKTCLNILEYCSGIATRTRRLVDRAQAVNPRISIVTTRKCFPGTRALSIMSVVTGGGFPHRLGLSETVLIFKQHVNFLNGFSSLPEMIDNLKTKSCEKKIIVEIENEEEAMLLAGAGIDGLQFDKWPTAELQRVVENIHRLHPEITCIAAGGINEANIEAYAATGVNAIATSALYFGKPSDIGAVIEKA